MISVNEYFRRNLLPVKNDNCYILNIDTDKLMLPIEYKKDLC